ncbi:hypothetical protein CIB84_007333 [Bambusicola thoracicus]|uniref:Uncharacterized protein n=1 Tax=Bambusicola thoracicus TaxID=9083 RepID=A0A2P4SXS3_BAMTH|nr:hypothetical protein CIB84_007333 [Bambusicola thoracicus]
MAKMVLINEINKRANILLEQLEIVFQIQRLLETNPNTDIAPPLKIRFTWDPSYWSKQLSNFGKNNIVFFIGKCPRTDKT